MKKSNHTPGPWRADGCDVYHLGRHVTYTGPHHTLDSEYPKSCRIVDEANAKRIADCVNACEGIDDPVWTIYKAKDMLQMIIDALGDEGRDGWMLGQVHKDECEYAKRALAELKGEA